MNALGIRDPEETMEIRRLNFMIQLCKNTITYGIIAMHIEKPEPLTTKNIMHQVVNLDLKDKMNLEKDMNTHDKIKQVIKASEARIKLTESGSEVEVRFIMDEAKVVKYLLENRNRTNNGILNTLIKNKT